MLYALILLTEPGLHGTPFTDWYLFGIVACGKIMDLSFGALSILSIRFCCGWMPSHLNAQSLWFFFLLPFHMDISWAIGVFKTPLLCYILKSLKYDADDFTVNHLTFRGALCRVDWSLVASLEEMRNADSHRRLTKHTTVASLTFVTDEWMRDLRYLNPFERPVN